MSFVPLLAEVEARSLKDFIEIVAYIAGSVAVVVGLIKAFRPKETTQIQSPLVVQPHKEFTPLEFSRQLQSEIKELRDQRKADVHGLHLKIEASNRDLRNDLAKEFKEVREDGVQRGEDIASLKTETIHQTRQIQTLDAKVDNLPERILKMLGGHSR